MERKRRILVVCQHFWPEQFRINDVVDFMLDEGYEVDVLCGRPNYPSGTLAPGYTLFNKPRDQYRTAQLYRAPEVPRGNNSTARILLNYLSFPFFSLFWVPWLLTKKYDRVFLYQLSPVMMSLAGIVIGKMKRVPIVMYVLDLWPENLFSVLPIKNRWLRALATKTSHWYYRRTSRIIALSNRMRERLLEVTNKTPDEIVVLPQTAEKRPEAFSVDAGLRQKFAATFNAVFTGNISPAQSFDTIIRAAEIIRDQGVDDIRWVVVGDGMSRASTEAEVQRRGLTELFVFEGYHPIETMPQYIDIADVLIGCLSKSDLLEATIPAKVFSYIAAGKPIVLAMDGEVQDLINNEIRCGFVGETEDAEALARNILAVYHSTQEQRATMSDRALAYHETHFKREVILRKLLDFIVG